MPPKQKFKKEEIVNVAMEIVRLNGLKGLNARKLAHELGCSVNPIFSHFSSMEELVSIVKDKIYEIYKQMMLEGMKNNSKPYKGTGLAYIEFAKQYPEYFKIIFMESSGKKAQKFIMDDTIGDDIIKSGQQLTGFSYEEQQKFHIKVWIFTHGIACLVATNTINLTSKEIDELLESSIRLMILGKKLEEK